MSDAAPDAAPAPLSSGSSFEDLGDFLAQEGSKQDAAAAAAQPVLAGEEEKGDGAAAAPPAAAPARVSDGKLPLPETAAAAASDITSDALFYWHDPVRSATVLSVGTLLFYLVCVEEYSLLSLAALVVGLNLLASGLFAVLAHDKSPVKSLLPAWRQAPTVVSLVAAVASTPLAAEAVAALRFVLAERVGPMVERGVRCKSVLQFLKTWNAVLTLYMVGCWFSVASLLYLAFLSAFTVPVAYRTFQTVVDAQVEKVSALVTGKWQEAVKGNPQLQQVVAFVTAGEDGGEAGKPKKA